MSARDIFIISTLIIKYKNPVRIGSKRNNLCLWLDQIDVANSFHEASII
jgi:hypothetical protein